MFTDRTEKGYILESFASEQRPFFLRVSHAHQTPRVTRLKDVARLAGVSTATASRILNERGPARVDDFRSAAALMPPLSAVEQHPMGIGAKAVKELGRVIESGQPSEPIGLMPTRLVIRASYGCRTTPG